MAKFNSANFDDAKAAFDSAVARSRADLKGASPAIVGLFVAMNKYSIASIEYMQGLNEHLDELERKLNIIDARLQGKTGPFDLKMRK